MRLGFLLSLLFGLNSLHIRLSRGVGDSRLVGIYALGGPLLGLGHLFFFGLLHACVDGFIQLFLLLSLFIFHFEELISRLPPVFILFHLCDSILDDSHGLAHLKIFYVRLVVEVVRKFKKFIYFIFFFVFFLFLGYSPSWPLGRFFVAFA